MNILSAIAKTILYCCGWVGLFLTCRVAAWLLEVPVWWSLPAALIIGMSFLLTGRILELTAARKRRLESQKPDNPRISARLRRSWERGRSLRKGRIFPPSPQPPWYICMEMPGSLHGHLVEIGDAAETDTSDHDDAFIWRRGPNAAWIDFPDAGPDDEEWRAFTNMIGSIPQFTPPAGVVIRVDSARMISHTHTAVHDDAPTIRKRLETLQKACRKQLPFYIVVDNVDRLYGLRSVFSKANPETLSAPLGRIRHNCRDDSAAFISAVIEECLSGFRLPDPDAGPAALQAPDEIRRLETPLIALIAQLGKNSAKGPCLRGLFLAATAPGGASVPPLLSRMPTFQTVDETLPVQPWFLKRLLREDIPADAEAARYEVGVPLRFAYPAGAAGLLAGSLVLCLLMTCSFMESRGVLLSARGRADAPKTPDTLEPYLELATITRLRNNGWLLPRFGMNEPEELEQVLKQRFTDSYFDLKTIPSIEHVQDAAIEAAASHDPAEIGNALLLLAVTRDGIGRNIARASNRDKGSRFLQTLVKSLRLASDEDMRQLETYFTWAGRQEWMPETYAALIDFEKYIVDNASGGDLSWLPDWTGRLPGLRAIDTSRVWDNPGDGAGPKSRIAPEWTINGYRAAQNLLEAIKYDSSGDEENRNAWQRKKALALSQYRINALDTWREAASVLWDGFRTRIPDAKTRDMFRDAAAGDDPAARFLQIVRHELMPMFENVGDAANADLHWLRLQARLLPPLNSGADPSSLPDIGELAGRLADAVRDLGADDGVEKLSRQLSSKPAGPASPIRRDWLSAMLQAGLAIENPEQNLEAVRTQYQAWSNPGHVNFSGNFAALQDAAEPAEKAHAYLRETSGSAAWDGLSPLATLDYMRYLATRQAALKLDAIWREKVYQPAQLTPGGDEERLVRLTSPGGALEKFLTENASGFWRWDGKRLVNTEWNRLEFMLDQEFLDFCSATLRDGKEKELVREQAAPPPLYLEAVHVDDGARERPVSVRILFGFGDEEQEVVFRNYRLKEMLARRIDEIETAKVSVVFPSLTATMNLQGAGLDGFLKGLQEGTVEFERDVFPSVEAALGRMGVKRITLKARMEGKRNDAGRSGAGTVEIPESVIVPGLAPGMAPVAPPAHGPLTLR